MNVQEVSVCCNAPFKPSKNIKGKDVLVCSACGNVKTCLINEQVVVEKEIHSDEVHRFALTSANSYQPGGTHYIKKSIQPWDYIAANDIGFFEGTVIRYLTRWRDKGGMLDLEKSLHYIQKLIEVEKAKGTK